MSSPIARLSGQTRASDAKPTVVEMDGEDADAVLDALSSDTARELYRAVHDQPAPPSELARRLETSVQNVHYHLSNLESAGVVEVLGTRYSEKGNEMNVYGLAADPIVLVGGATDADRTALRQSLADWAAAVAALAFASLAVQLAANRLVGDVAPGFFEPASRGPAARAIVETVAEPGLLFFLGGLLVVAAVALRDHGAV